MMKRTLSMLLALVMALGLCVPALAAEPMAEQDIQLVEPAAPDGLPEEAPAGEPEAEPCDVPAPASVSLTASPASLTAGKNEAITLTAEGQPKIKFAVDGKPEIVVGTDKVSVVLEIENTDDSNFKFNTGVGINDFTVSGCNLTLSEVEYISQGKEPSVVVLRFTGAAKAGNLTIKANGSAFTDPECSDSNELTITVPDKTKELSFEEGKEHVTVDHTADTAEFTFQSTYEESPTVKVYDSGIGGPADQTVTGKIEGQKLTLTHKDGKKFNTPSKYWITVTEDGKSESDSVQVTVMPRTTTPVFEEAKPVEKGASDATFTLTNKGDYEDAENVKVTVYAQETEGPTEASVTGAWSKDGTVTLTNPNKFTRAVSEYWLTLCYNEAGESERTKVTVKTSGQTTAPVFDPAAAEVKNGAETAEFTVSNKDEYTANVNVKVYNAASDGEPLKEGISAKYADGTVTLTNTAKFTETKEYWLTLTDPDNTESARMKVTVTVKEVSPDPQPDGAGEDGFIKVATPLGNKTATVKLAAEYDDLENIVVEFDKSDSAVHNVDVTLGTDKQTVTLTFDPALTSVCHYNLYFTAKGKLRSEKPLKVAVTPGPMLTALSVNGIDVSFPLGTAGTYEAPAALRLELSSVPSSFRIKGSWTTDASSAATYSTTLADLKESGKTLQRDVDSEEITGSNTVYILIADPTIEMESCYALTIARRYVRPQPTATPAPTASPEPSASPEPGTSPEPGPDATPEPGPSATPEPAPVPSDGTGWSQNDDGEWFYYSDGKAETGWLADSSDRYYLDENGKMATGLQTVTEEDGSTSTYYFNEAHDGSYGALQTGWHIVDNQWRYFDTAAKALGKMLSSQWIEDGGKWYYVADTGVMEKGLTQVPNDGWYYLNPNHNGTAGAILSGWQLIDNQWRYFNPKHNGSFGKMAAGQWISDGGKWYYVDEDGVMEKGLTQVPNDGLYYLNPNHNGTAGAILSGWQTIDGERYYFETRHNGAYGRAYVDGTFTIGGKSYTFGADGKLITD